ncbi:hypothetical protein EMIHUDRAFT_197717 [Emiliania huxleyi CCMP1516]|uniref:Uncharacterized protein n=2 Tax=Emiliania huxleyi TaxID=2903 RepID=A0A0D3IDM0_EMIH1|nr:hypothetical protein EMIHUDRAFT_197717 [Emiliania huxleyi CCMP1516]EOD09355.1 hypothetical protein EMIHUDRAFT_197717 [Emiliania huxleyi CCMP1516]|eukprot:XP_005761784.1 hypothetical protein EMIHUDRAFT_197717 [Emiliania huxleyi CCMP1516]
MAKVYQRESLGPRKRAQKKLAVTRCRAVSARPMRNGWQVPLAVGFCCGMPHGCDWPAPRRVSSAWRSDRGQRNSPGLNAQPGAPARAFASHGACNAQQCSLASPRANATVLAADSPPPAKEAQRQCGSGDAWQAGHVS